jgi:hypothetical protein
MKSILGASLLAGLLAFAAGCSSADAGRGGVEPNGDTPSKDEGAQGTPVPAVDDTRSSLAQSLQAADSSAGLAINPCAAATCLVGTTCEVIDGQATCTPAQSDGRFCGGFAGIACPGAGSCVDDPSDDCDPERGGADCGGICACSGAAVSCLAGDQFDDSPDVCACVPAEPEPDACAAVRCRAGTHCEARRDRARCVPDAPEPENPCAAVLCPVDTTCDVVDGKAQCTPIEPPAPFCGGIAAFECPGQGSCVDNPNDGCDPERGGADCGGVCECNVRALCIRGSVFDASPAVCACVPTPPEVDACATVRCRGGTHCEVVDDRAICASDEPTNPCAAASCLTGTVCVDRDGEAVCIPADSEACE